MNDINIKKSDSLFYETAHKLKRVIEKMGIEKRDKGVFAGMFT